MSSGVSVTSAAVPGVTEPDPALQHAERLGMVVDLDRCIGCWTCAVACKQENDVAEGLYLLRILTVGGDGIDKPSGTYPDVSLAYQATNCFHCDNPPCVKACPVAATYKRPDGIVAVDYDRCIGCRYCMVACPYNNRVFNWRAPQQDPPPNVAPVGEVPARPKGVVEKCTFCTHRVTKGYRPRCVIACPVGARTFGDLADPNSDVSILVRQRPGYVVFPERGTKPSVHYLLRSGPESEGGAL
jgi:molybdopterin-containing oxidoreductase family iron-sulfur binding subunit